MSASVGIMQMSADTDMCYARRCRASFHGEGAVSSFYLPSIATRANVLAPKKYARIRNLLSFRDRENAKPPIVDE